MPHLLKQTSMLLCFQKAILPTLIFTSIALKADPYTGQEKIIAALMHRGDFDRALDHLIEIEFSAKSLPKRLSAVIRSSDIYRKSGKHLNAIRVLSDFLERESNELNIQQKDSIHMEIAICFLLTQNSEAARYHLNLISEERRPDINLKNTTNMEDLTAFDSPYLEAFMSAVIPGSGQILAGRPADALTNLFMIALPLTIGIKASQNDEKAFASTAYFFASFFYFGNIANAYKIQSAKLSKKKEKTWNSYISTKIIPQIKEGSNKVGVGISIEAKIPN